MPFPACASNQKKSYVCL